MRMTVVAVGMLVAGCAARSGDVSRQDQEDVMIQVHTDRERYEPGAPVHLELVIHNDSSHPVTFQFSSGQRYDFAVMRVGGGVEWRWSADRAFLQALGEEQIGPGEELVFAESYRGTLPAGQYVVVGTLTSRDRPLRAETPFEVR